MKNLQFLLVTAAFVAVPAIAQSAEPVVQAALATEATAPLSIRSNATVFSADGRRVGRIDHVRSVKGTPVIASVVYSGQFVNIPVASLTAKGGNWVSSMTLADLVKR